MSPDLRGLVFVGGESRSGFQTGAPPRADAVCAPARLGHAFSVPDDLYDRDIFAWSEHQADLLRRLARGERVDEVNSEHVVEEIEDVGRSELHDVQSHLRQMLARLLIVRGWPDGPPVNHWRGEIAAFQKDALRRFAPSMRQRIDLDRLYADALGQPSPCKTMALPRCLGQAPARSRSTNCCATNGLRSRTTFALHPTIPRPDRHAEH